MTKSSQLLKAKQTTDGLFAHSVVGAVSNDAAQHWVCSINRLSLFIQLLHSVWPSVDSSFNGSLCRSAKRSPCFKIVSNISSFVLGRQLEVVLLTLFSFSLDVQILVVVPADRLAFFAIEGLSLLSNKFIETIMGSVNSGLMLLWVNDSQHFVIVLVYVELHWVLVVREQRVVSVRQVSECSTLYTNGLDQKQKDDLRCRRSSRLATCSTVVWRSDA